MHVLYIIIYVLSLFCTTRESIYFRRQDVKTKRAAIIATADTHFKERNTSFPILYNTYHII